MKKFNYRKEARDRPCQVRTSVCNYNPFTTVLSHLNGAGMGRKHNDIHGAWCCSACHTWLDGGYAKLSTSDTRDLLHYRGIIRTQEILIEEGKL